MYLDAINVYGCAISQNLPIGGFKWKKKNLFKNLKIVIKDIYFRWMLNILKN